MTARILPPEEYSKLAGTYLEPLIGLFPVDADVIVVEDEAGAVVGCTSIFLRDHLEGTWIAEAYRHSPIVARRLWQAITATAKRRKDAVLVTASIEPAIDALLLKHGAQPLPGTHYVWPVKES